MPVLWQADIPHCTSPNNSESCPSICTPRPHRGIPAPPAVTVRAIDLDNNDGQQQPASSGQGRESLWSSDYSSPDAGVKMAAGLDALFGFILLVFIAGCIYQWRRGRLLDAAAAAARQDQGRGGGEQQGGEQQDKGNGQREGGGEGKGKGQGQSGSGEGGGVLPPAYEENEMNGTAGVKGTGGCCGNVEKRESGRAEQRTENYSRTGCYWRDRRAATGESSEAPETLYPCMDPKERFDPDKTSVPCCELGDVCFGPETGSLCAKVQDSNPSAEDDPILERVYRGGCSSPDFTPSCSLNCWKDQAPFYDSLHYTSEVLRCEENVTEGIFYNYCADDGIKDTDCVKGVVSGPGIDHNQAWLVHAADFRSPIGTAVRVEVLPASTTTPTSSASSSASPAPATSAGASPELVIGLPVTLAVVIALAVAFFFYFRDRRKRRDRERIADPDTSSTPAELPGTRSAGQAPDNPDYEYKHHIQSTHGPDWSYSPPAPFAPIDSPIWQPASSNSPGSEASSLLNSPRSPHAFQPTSTHDFEDGIESVELYAVPQEHQVHQQDLLRQQIRHSRYTSTLPEAQQQENPTQEQNHRGDSHQQQEQDHHISELSQQSEPSQQFRHTLPHSFSVPSHQQQQPVQQKRHSLPQSATFPHNNQQPRQQRQFTPYRPPGSRSASHSFPTDHTIQTSFISELEGNTLPHSPIGGYAVNSPPNIPAASTDDESQTSAQDNTTGMTPTNTSAPVAELPSTHTTARTGNSMDAANHPAEAAAETDTQLTQSERDQESDVASETPYLAAAASLTTPETTNQQPSEPVSAFP
ncbi:hypothetical protein QBC35DRAFT_545165 [Podospora australis]|uniref:Uncharacterized protein n=1 Tax=Podospora australis TaxID=1536484 RepID=A0AAN6WXB7_9PEZI|nr:hypothetical protein QBC35DRAFT_545165 [Podospora australis]